MAKDTLIVARADLQAAFDAMNLMLPGHDAHANERGNDPQHEKIDAALDGLRRALGIVEASRMAKVTIYGASDDLIECEGDLVEEWGAYNAGKTKIEFGDGTVLSIEYDSEGCWRIARLQEGSASYVHTPATDPDDDYSDRVTLTGALGWVRVGRGKREAINP